MRCGFELDDDGASSERLKDDGNSPDARYLQGLVLYNEGSVDKGEPYRARGTAPRTELAADAA